ncbi:MAG: hypothetical protein ABIO46_02000 [Chitinophagales bacterium]
MKQSFLLYKKYRVTLLMLALLIMTADATYAGGPWVLGKGQTTLSLGFSRKVGKERWQHYHLDPNSTPKNLTDDVDSFALVHPPDSATVDGKFHDFRYYYFQGAIGIAKNLELNWTLNWLEGREAQTRDPKTGQLHTYTDSEGNMVIGANGAYHYAQWELNSGFTDSWLGLKYQFLKGKWPMAVEINSRFPDLYQQPGEPYTRYNYQYLLYNYNDVDNDTSYSIRDTLVEAGSEWRGLNGRDIALMLHTGHSFFKNGALYLQAFAGYNWRSNLHLKRTAYSDQLLIGINGGYNVRINDKIALLPKFWVDYTGGIGNGGQPIVSDRFYSPYKNNNFNNSKALRGYLNMDFIYNNRLDVQAGLGKWLWGRGSVKYTEVFVQVTYLLGKG